MNQSMGVNKLAVIAFGGNALLRSGQKGSYQEQMENIAETCNSLSSLFEENYNLVIAHGNGPQVGNTMLRHEAGEKKFGIEAMPMNFCVAETQGSIGYLIEQGLRNMFTKQEIQRNIVSILTQVEVDKEDPAFDNPIKPVGPYYSREEAEYISKKTGYQFKEDPKGNGWRKVVPSPSPKKISNIELIGELAQKGNVVICVGGGGIPIIKQDSGVIGIEAVIDKDLASALTAVEIGADEFYILTDIPKVYINFRKENEEALDEISIAEAEEYLRQGHFTEGSMAPKIRAAIHFASLSGKSCIITNTLNDPKAGTRIIP